MNKKISVVVLSLLVCVMIVFTTITVSAGTCIVTEDWSYEIPSATNKTEYYIDEYLGDDTDVVIPATHNDRTIVKIKSNAFSGDIETCVIPYSIIEICSNAFLGCEALKSITIPNTVQLIGASTFANCISMESFVVKDKAGIDYIPASCCSGNTALVEAYIGSGVESIYNYAFKNCQSLEKITIAPTVIEIYTKAFDGCDKLTIYGYDGSYALEYAEANDIPYVNLGVYVEPTEPATTTAAPTETSTEITTEATVPSESSSVVTSSVATDPSESSTAATDPDESSTATTTSDVTEPSTAEKTDGSEITSSEAITTDATEAPTSTSGDITPTSSVTDTSSTSPVATTVLLPTGSSTVVEKLKYFIGDADLDYRITVKDATKIQKHIAKILTLSEISLVLADANNDEKVSVKDATQIQKYIAGFKDIPYVGTEVKL